MGKLLKETELAKGGEQYHNNTTGPPGEPVPTLSELGLTRNQSSDAQFLADLPEEIFEEVKKGIEGYSNPPLHRLGLVLDLGLFLSLTSL